MTVQMWAAYFALLFALGAVALSHAVVITLSPGDPRIIGASTNFAYQQTVDGKDEYVVTVETTQNDEILGKGQKLQLFESARVYAMLSNMTLKVQVDASEL